MAIKFLGVEIPEGFEERGPTTANDKYQYYTAEEITGTESGLLSVTATITSEQILATER